MTVESLLEMTLWVGDLDRSAKFYQAIGLELFSDEEPGIARNFECVIGHTTVTTVQLYQATAERPISHVVLGFRVSDIAAAVTRLDDLGVQWRCVLPDYIITSDPDGNVVSVKQENPSSAADRPTT